MASALVYGGLLIAVAGVALLLRPVLWFSTTARCLVTSVAGAAMAGIGLALPASESRATGAEMRLDDFAPVWQFRERHSTHVEASPDRAFEAVRSVRADEIFLFNALIWIRAGGRSPGELREDSRDASLIDVATRSSFLRLVDEPPRELVVGTVVIAPAGRRGRPTPELYTEPLPPGIALATMNFLVVPEGTGARVSTETRIYASDESARRRFAAYWRLIYPGSAFIRRMWLRAIKRRAEAPRPEGTS